MTNSKRQILDVVKRQRLGLSMILGSLIVIALIAYMSVSHQRVERMEFIRAQGFSLVQLISEVPAPQLTTQTTRNTLNILRESLKGADFAYAVVVDSNGTPLSEVTQPGVIVPPVQAESEPSNWVGERDVIVGDDRAAIEFYSPFLINTEYRGSVRLGFFKPGTGLIKQQIPYLASLALPVFLLTPLFYFLTRFQLRPLQQTQREIAMHMKTSPIQSVDLAATGELGEFMQNFNQYFQQANSEIKKLESNNHSMLASSKVLHYKFNRIESVIEAFPFAILVFDDSGRLMHANNKVASLLGVKKEDVLEQPVASWCTDDELFRYLARCSDPSNRAMPELRTSLGEGNKTKHVSIAAFPLLSSNDSSSRGNLVLISDVAREVAAEAGREEFVAHISHELKTPLNTLMMYSEAMLGEDGRDEHFRVEGLNVIYDEAERMAGLINNLLSITKIETGSMNIDRQRVKFNEFIDTTFAAIEKGAHDSGLIFHLNMPGDVLSVAIDKELMRIAVNNLLTNAVKYNRPGGTVTLNVEDLDSTVRVTVSDTGIGISAEDLEHVFDKFYRSDSDEVRDRTGHGLGLSLAYDIVQLHNGRLSVTSEINKGTEFVIELSKQSDLLQKTA